MFLIPTSQAEHLAKNIREKGVQVLCPELNRDKSRRFPDGELYARITRPQRLTGKRVVLLHSGAPLPNDGLVELELLLRIAKESRPAQLDVFFAYFPYGMQDEVFRNGETNAAEGLAEKLTWHYRVKNMFVVDAHFTGKAWTAKYPLRLCSALPLLMEATKREYGQDMLCLSPDKGGKRRTNFQCVQKRRKNSYEIEMCASGVVQKKMRGQTVAVVDDLIETGGTLERFAKECRRAGAKKLVALATHGVLPQGIQRVKKAYDKLRLTNSIARKEANVDITPLILDAIG